MRALNGLGNTLILLFSLVSIIGVLELIHNMQLRSLTRASEHIKIWKPYSYLVDVFQASSLKRLTLELRAEHS